MFKKFIAGVLAFAAIGSATSAFAAVTGREAVALARREVPAHAVNFGLALEGTGYLVSFYDENSYRDFAVNVDSASGKITAVSSRGSNSVGSTMLTKAEADVTQAVLAQYPDAEKLTVKLVRQGRNNQFYEAAFSTPKFRQVTIEVSPVTCAFGKINMLYR